MKKLHPSLIIVAFVILAAIFIAAFVGVAQKKNARFELNTPQISMKMEAQDE